jgi:hypothetical protein
LRGLQAAWNNRPRVLFRKEEILVLRAFKGHLTLDVRSVTHAIKTGLMIIPGGMTSQLHVLVHVGAHCRTDVAMNPSRSDRKRILKCCISE